MGGRIGRIAHAFRWILAAVALAFVVWAVPILDRCWDPRAPTSTHVAVSRETDACVLHLRRGTVRISSETCGELRCEPGLASTLGHARATVIAGLLGLYGLGTLAWAARWRALLGFAGVGLPLGRVWRISIEAQAGGVVLPGGIGGDALRIASIVGRPREAGEPESKLAMVVASVLLDRAVGLAVVTAMAAVLAFVWGGGLHAGQLAAGIALIPLLLVAAFVVLRQARLPGVARLLRGRAGRVIGPVLEYVRHPAAPRAIAAAAALSVVVAGVQFATIRGLVFALGAAPTHENWVYLGTAMAFVVSALPTLPGAWGTADATYVLFFGLAGLAPGTALAVCLLYRFFWYLSGIAGALLHLARPRHPSALAGADPPADSPA